MAPRRGFASGDFDPAFPLDDRFTELAGTLDPAAYLAATGLYFHVLAAAWRDARRASAVRIYPEAPPSLVAALQAVGLLDGQGMVRRRSFDRWVGAAVARRTADADRKRLARARAEPASSDTPRTPSRSPVRRTSAAIPTGQVQVVAPPSKGNARAPRETTDPEAPAIAWLAGHDALVMPTGNGLHRRLMDDAERHGPAKLVAALEDVWAAGGRTAGQLVLGASNFLNPIPTPATVQKQERASESERASAASRARTEALRREREEWVADAEPPSQDTPRRVGSMLHRPTSAGN